MNHRPTLTARLRRLTAAVVSPRLEPVLLAVTAGALTAGGIAWLADAGSLADPFWGLGTLSAVIPAVGWVLSALRHGHAGVDLIAVLALGGTLAVREYLAGALIFDCIERGRGHGDRARGRQRASLTGREPGGSEAGLPLDRRPGGAGLTVGLVRQPSCCVAVLE
jgi:hypothetical protein